MDANGTTAILTLEGNVIVYGGSTHHHHVRVRPTRSQINTVLKLEPRKINVRIVIQLKRI